MVIRYRFICLTDLLWLAKSDYSEQSRPTHSPCVSPKKKSQAKLPAIVLLIVLTSVNFTID